MTGGFQLATYRWFLDGQIEHVLKVPGKQERPVMGKRQNDSSSALFRAHDVLSNGVYDSGG